MSRQRQKGLTLVETLVAVTTMSVLFTGLAAHLRGGVMVWHRATTTVESLKRQRRALDQLARDLASAIVYETAHTEALDARLLSEEARWVTVRPTTPQGPGRVEVVTYRCAQVEGVPGLWRTRQAVGEALAGREATSELLAPSCEELSFRYAYLPETGTGPLVWQDTWQDRERLPRLIAVTFRVEPGREIRRIIGIPSGVLKPWTSE